VDNFLVKYTNLEHAKLLIKILRQWYELTKDWDATNYYGIKLNWDYSKRECKTSVPKYMPNVLHKFHHQKPIRPQDSPFPCAPSQFGKKAQEMAPEDNTPPLDQKGKKRIEKIVGSLLHYARAVDTALLKALNSMSRKQSAPTKLTEEWSNRALDYVATHPNAEVLYKASDITLKVHSNASYLNEDQARSSHGGYFFLGWKQHDIDPLQLNGCILAAVGLLKLVAASAAESELGGLFCNAQDVTIMRLTLSEMGCPQRPIDAYVDNSTACGAANSTIKKQRSRAMNMRYFWTADQVNERNIRVLWAPGLENLADYFTKHHLASHHRKVRPCCVNIPNSPASLQKAPTPRDLRGCVNPSTEAYRTSRTPLPMVAAAANLQVDYRQIQTMWDGRRTDVTTVSTWCQNPCSQLSTAWSMPVTRRHSPFAQRNWQVAEPTGLLTCCVASEQSLLA